MITEIAMCSFITLFVVCARSGHFTGTSLESYMDPMNPLHSLPAANALHRNITLNMKPVMQVDGCCWYCKSRASGEIDGGTLCH
jgi:hypothetical protein